MSGRVLPPEKIFQKSKSVSCFMSLSYFLLSRSFPGRALFLFRVHDLM